MQARTGLVPGQVSVLKLGQVRLGHLKLGQVKSGQARTGLAPSQVSVHRPG